MIYALEAAKEQACYIRFFNGAKGAGTADIFVNGELIVEDLTHGAFTNFRKAKPGVYNIEVRVVGEGTEMDYNELMSFEGDVAYTLALTGDADHLGMAVITFNMQQDVVLPNIRFANLILKESVIDIEIDKQKAVTGLMFKEVSDNIKIEQGKHTVTVFDADGDKILEDGIDIAAKGNYLAIISGEIGGAQNLPGLYVAEESPVL